MYVFLAPPLGSTWAENSSCSPLFPRAESKVWPGQALSKCSWKGLVGGFRSQCRSLPGVMDCRSVCLKLRAVPHCLLHTGTARPLETFLQALSPALLYFPGALASQTSVLWLCYAFSQIHALPTPSFLTWISCTLDELLCILHDLVQMSLPKEPFPVAQLCPHYHPPRLLVPQRDLSVPPRGDSMELCTPEVTISECVVGGGKMLQWTLQSFCRPLMSLTRDQKGAWGGWL